MDDAAPGAIRHLLGSPARVSAPARRGAGAGLQAGLSAIDKSVAGNRDLPAKQSQYGASRTVSRVILGGTASIRQKPVMTNRSVPSSRRDRGADRVLVARKARRESVP